METPFEKLIRLALQKENKNAPNFWYTQPLIVEVNGWFLAGRDERGIEIWRKGNFIYRGSIN